ncbi:hypothetical protein NL676_038962 [Syzygium grande]|nr:hypothetical protein NL676_038962 [Syzygium grande]
MILKKRRLPRRGLVAISSSTAPSSLRRRRLQAIDSSVPDYIQKKKKKVVWEFQIQLHDRGAFVLEAIILLKLDGSVT